MTRRHWSVKRKLDLLVVTSSRADYCHLYWPLRAFEKSPVINPRLVVTGAHLSAGFGSTARVIESDGFTIASQVPCLDQDDSDCGMARTIGQAISGFAEVFDRLRPDLVLLPADRYEMLAPASAALALRIPIAHIEGGEISEGAIDNAVRNALTMMSHVHFTSTARARARVIGMGEESWRVHHVGAPSLDHYKRPDLLTRQQVEDELEISLEPTTVLVGYHPVTLDIDTTSESHSVVAALDSAIDQLNVQVLICNSNADAGGRRIVDRMKALCKRHPTRAHFVVNLEPRAYWSLLRQVDLLVGNSSSGIMEAGSVPVGAVDIGWRQRGRERGINVIGVPGDQEAILTAMGKGLSYEFRKSLKGMKNIYGDSQSAQRITGVLEDLPAADRLLEKRYSV